MWRVWFLVWFLPAWVHEAICWLTGRILVRMRSHPNGATIRLFWQREDAYDLAAAAATARKAGEQI